MAGFDKAWLAIAGKRNGEPVSPRLRPLLQAVYLKSLAEPLDPMALKRGLEELLVFLSGDGRSRGRFDWLCQQIRHNAVLVLLPSSSS
jgi:hypothetical protein